MGSKQGNEGGSLDGAIIDYSQMAQVGNFLVPMARMPVLLWKLGHQASGDLLKMFSGEGNEDDTRGSDTQSPSTHS